MQNREPVETKFLLMTFTMPRVLLLFLTSVVNFTRGILMSLWVFYRPTDK